MGLIQDESGKPLEAEKADDKPAGNGANHAPNLYDVRAIPTGTLLFNFVRVIGEEQGIENFIQQMEAAKAAKGMVGDPPQLVRANEVWQPLHAQRVIMGRELNARFAKVDEERRKEVGIEIVMSSEYPTEKAPVEVPAPAPADDAKGDGDAA